MTWPALQTSQWHGVNSQINDLALQTSRWHGVNSQINDLALQTSQWHGINNHVNDLTLQTSQWLGVNSQINDLASQTSQWLGVNSQVNDLAFKINGSENASWIEGKYANVYLQASLGPSINSYAKGVFLNYDCKSRSRGRSHVSWSFASLQLKYKHSFTVVLWRLSSRFSTNRPRNRAKDCCV